MNKILITGGTGFIGSHLIEYLVKDGVPNKSIKLMIPPWDSLTNLRSGIYEVYIGDVRDKADCENAMKSVDIVYHLAAKTVIKNSSYGYYKDTNLDGTVNMINAAIKNKVKKFIYFSSISVFGLPAWRGDMININEKSDKNYSESYGRTKLEAENILIKTAKKSKLPYIIIRPTTVYGPRDKAGIYQLVNILKKGKYFFIGNALNKMDYIYVEDLVRAARMSEKSKIINEDFIIGACKPITQKFLVETIANQLRIRMTKIHIPRSLALLVSYPMLYISQIVKKEPILFPNRVKVLTANCYFNCKKAMKILRYNPKFSFDRGIQETIASLSSQQ